MTQQSISDHDLGRFEAILKVRLTDLEHGIRERDGIAIEQSADQLDEIQHASARELLISHIDRESKQLRDVRAALRRLRDGTFGVCQECEEQIHLKRLVAIPWASLCIHCQEALDCPEAVEASITSHFEKAA